MPQVQEMSDLVALDAFDMWLQEAWEALICPSPLLAPSPPGYFEAKEKLDEMDRLE